VLTQVAIVLVDCDEEEPATTGVYNFTALTLYSNLCTTYQVLNYRTPSCDTSSYRGRQDVVRWYGAGGMSIRN